VVTEKDIRKDAFLFGEAQSRIVVSVPAEKATAFENEIKGIAFKKLGLVTSGSIEIDQESWGRIEDWKELYDTAIEKMLSKELESEGALSHL
jgi:phosphoribosylformylglycinamidine synthase